MLQKIFIQNIINYIHFVKLGRKKIERLIRSIGIFRIKAKSVYNLSKTLVEKYKGKVPKTFEELEDLPGVGHKTASVVMSQGFGLPSFSSRYAYTQTCSKMGFNQWKKCCSNRKGFKTIISKKILE